MLFEGRRPWHEAKAQPIIDHRNAAGGKGEALAIGAGDIFPGGRRLEQHIHLMGELFAERVQLALAEGTEQVAGEDDVLALTPRQPLPDQMLRSRLHRLPHLQAEAAAEIASDEASGWKPDDLPFDIRHRRTMTYNLSEGADAKTKQTAAKMLARNLADALRANLGQYIESRDAARDIEGVAAKPDNPSVWASAGATLEHNDSLGRGHKSSVTLPDCPRGYIRIIPASWKNRVPLVHEIANVGDDAIVWPPSGGTGSGNYGVCEEGFVRYWWTGTDADGRAEARNVAMFFDETGEFWLLHGTAIREGRHGAALAFQVLIDGWARAMDKLRHARPLGASPMRKVEAGLVGVRGVTWPGQWQFEAPPARKDRCIAVRQHRDWGNEARIGFLTDAYNKVRDLFGFPRASPEDTNKLLSR